MLELLEELLDVNVIQSGHLQLRPVPTDLRTLLGPDVPVTVIPNPVVTPQMRQAAEAPTEGIREGYQFELATAHNQLAWLVSNTEGDYDEALRSSQRSLELRPETPGYLDTLGRCYYAKGDYKSAVLYQSRAAELEPHSVQIRRQLEFFQAALKAAQSQAKQ